MQKYAVVLGNGDQLAVHGQMEVGPTNVLYVKNGNEVLQAFAPGAWMTYFKMSAIARPSDLLNPTIKPHASN